MSRKWFMYKRKWTLTLLGTGLFFLSLFLSFHLPFVQKKLTASLIARAQEEGITLSYGQIQTLFPFYWHIDTLSLETKNERLSLEDVTVHFSLFSLVRKELSLPLIEAKRGSFGELSFALKGSLLLRRNGTGRAECALREEGEGSLIASCSLFSRDEEVSASLRLLLPRAGALLPSFPPLKGELLLSLAAPRANWEALLTREQGERLPFPIRGEIKGAFDLTKIELFSKSPEEWKIAGSCLLWSDLSLDVTQALLESPTSTLKGSFSLDPNQNLLSLRAKGSTRDLSEFYLGEEMPAQSGDLEGEFSLRENGFTLSLASKELSFGEHHWTNLTAAGKGKKEREAWAIEGEIAAADPKPIRAKGSGYYEEGGEAYLELLTLSVGQNQLEGDLLLSWKNRSLEGNFAICLPSASDLSSYAQTTLPSGELRGTLRFALAPEKNHWYADLSGSSLKLDAYSASSLFLLLDYKEEEQKKRGECSLTLYDLSYADLHFSNLILFTPIETDASHFRLSGQGEWKSPFTLLMTGIWEGVEGGIDLELSSLHASGANESFLLKNPCSLLLSKEQIVCSACHLASQIGEFQGSFSSLDGNLLAEVSAKHIPIDLLSLVYPKIELEGRASFGGFLTLTEKEQTGRLDLRIEEANLISSQVEGIDTLRSKGSLHCNLEGGALQVHSHFLLSQAQFFDLSATLPICYSPEKQRLFFDEQSPLSGQITLEGELEKLFDFVQLRSHLCRGLLSTHLFLGGTPLSPLLQGKIEVQGGSYRNFATGTFLHNIFAEVIAEGHSLTLRELTASDEGEGKVSAKGEVFFLPKEQFPYHLEAELDHLRLLNLEKVAASLSGPISITGNQKEGYARGDLRIDSAELFLPDRIAPPLPEISVSYRNQKRGITPPAPLKIYPLHLDLHLTGENKIFVRGRGLSSEWKGEAHVRGKATELTVTGGLELLKGQYLFAGKQFSMTQGEIVFSPQAYLQSHLAVSGQTDLPGMKVLVTLRGPLIAPELHFSSLPPMPQSAILSHVVFNKEIGELSALQAIQLAHLIVSLSRGGSADMLEAIRRGLGIDRLNLVSKIGSDDISVQIGKYLVIDKYFVDGVMVTLSQSTTSSDIIVEVELKKGFIFQAETQEQEEGKFTLKWNYNY